MTDTDIKIEMIRKNIKLKDLASKLDVSIPSICRTRKGLLVSKRIRKGIADAIERPVDNVFPPNKAA